MPSPFFKLWEKVSPEIKSQITVMENFELGNQTVVDIALFLGDKCLAFGNFYEFLETPTEEKTRKYFYGNHGFMSCGTPSRLWFFFDNESILINDHKWLYPYDELMENVQEFVSRMGLDQ